MIPAEVLKKIRQIHIKTTRLAVNVFAGEYKSVFKGRGLEFHQVREYLPGDEIRLIDWNVTARGNKPYVKEYIEERELTIMVLLDASKSGYFGSINSLKSEIAAELASVLAASANKNNDKVGLIIFSDRIEKFIPPRKGQHHILRIVREALYHKSEGTGTDIPMCLKYLNQVTSRSTVSFLISDFYAQGIKKPLSIANKRHDIVAVKITDPRDFEIPNCGLITLKDAESNKRFTLNTSSRAVRKRFSDNAAKESAELEQLLRSVNIDMVNISTDSSYIDPLVKFFKERQMRRRRE